MTVMKLGFLSLLLLAAAVGGCTKRKTETKTHTSAPVITQPTVAIERAWMETERTKITISLPSPNGRGKVFRGTLGTYDQDTFENVDGADPASKEMLYVVSLDKDSSTLIAILYKDGGRDSGGVAYTFRRTRPTEPYALAWSLPGLTSKTATDIDTYMRDRKATAADAVVAVQLMRTTDKSVAAELAFK